MSKATNKTTSTEVATGDATAVKPSDAGTATFVKIGSVTTEPGDVTGVLDANLVQPLPTAPIGYVIRCHRDRGIWRAGRFWTPESTPVATEDLTTEQLDALRTEPLLSVLPVQE